MAANDSVTMELMADPTSSRETIFANGLDKYSEFTDKLSHGIKAQDIVFERVHILNGAFVAAKSTRLVLFRTKTSLRLSFY